MLEKLTPNQFDLIRHIIFEKASIVVGDNREYFVIARLNLLMKKLGITKIDNLLHTLTSNPSADVNESLIDVMTINETSFYRDQTPFNMLKAAVLPKLIEQNSRNSQLKIWCGACSSGQEPYSIAMLLEEYFPDILKNWHVKIIATDISQEILKQAREGVYNRIEVNRGLPVQLLVKYFEQDGIGWKISDKIRRHVEFQTCNLSDPKLTIPEVDIVFLRNVLIYFNDTTRQQILTRIAHSITDNGYLFLGSSETLINLSTPFKLVQIAGGNCFQPLAKRTES